MNKYLDEQIKYFFGKSFDDMSTDEKMEITALTLSKNNFRGEPNDISISELRCFPNLKRCLLQEFALTDEDIETLRSLSTLKGVQFSNCSFAGVKEYLSNFELVVLNSCRNVPPSILRGNADMKYLRVINQDYFDATILSDCVALERAYLQKTTVANILALKRLPNLQLVNLDGSRFNFLALRKLKNDFTVEYKREYLPGIDR